MIDPASGPFLFDTSAESWLARAPRPEIVAWLRSYLALHAMQVSAVTVLERVRGYGTLWWHSPGDGRPAVESARLDDLARGARVLPVDAAAAVVSGELMALVPAPPTPPRHSRGSTESRQARLARSACG